MWEKGVVQPAGTEPEGYAEAEKGELEEAGACMTGVMTGKLLRVGYDSG